MFSRLAEFIGREGRAAEELAAIPADATTTRSPPASEPPKSERDLMIGDVPERDAGSAARASTTCEGGILTSAISVLLTSNISACNK